MTPTYDARAQRADLFITIGDDFLLSLDWYDSDTGLVVDLTGYTPSATLIMDDNATLTFDMTGTILSSGALVFILTRTQTTTLSPGVGVWEMVVRDPDDLDHTYLNGNVRALTRAEMRNR